MAAPLKSSSISTNSNAYRMILYLCLMALQIIKVRTLDLDPRQNALEVDVKAHANGSSKLVVLCYPGADRLWHRLWINPQVTMSGLDLSDSQVFYGSNDTDVREKSQAATLLTWPRVSEIVTGQHAFVPFNKSCIGVASTHNYTINFAVNNPEWRFVVYTALGILLFCYASVVSRNVALHYGAGISFGVLGSILIVMFIMNRFLPNTLKRVSYAAMAISASVSMFLMRFLYGQIQELLYNHWQMFLSYVAMAGLLSFAVMYRYGPVTDPRSLDLIKWMLQGIGLTLIYQGSQIPEMAVAAIALTLTFHLFPRAWLTRATALRYASDGDGECSGESSQSQADHKSS